jgi:hypothetical protein
LTSLGKVLGFSAVAWIEAVTALPFCLTKIGLLTFQRRLLS